MSGPLAPITPAPDDNTGLGRGSTGDTTNTDPEVDDNDVFLVVAVVLGVLALLLVGFAQRARQRNMASHNIVLSTPVMAPWSDSIIINRARSSTTKNAHCKLCPGAVPVPLCYGAIVHPKHWMPGPAASQTVLTLYIYCVPSNGVHCLLCQLEKKAMVGRSLHRLPNAHFRLTCFYFRLPPRNIQ